MFNRVLALMILSSAVNLVLGFGESTEKQNSTRIVFIAPSSLHQDKLEELQLNNKQNLWQGNRFQRGWHIEANQALKVVVFLLTTNNSSSHKGDESAVARPLKSPANSSTIAHLYYLYFTTDSQRCDDYSEHSHIPVILTENSTTRHLGSRLHKVEIDVRLRHYAYGSYYVCLKQESPNVKSDNSAIILPLFQHQGDQPWLCFVTYEHIVPLWANMLVYTVLVILNGIFTGLNLGLMALSVDELNLLAKVSESEKERRYALQILPLRKKGNFLLCTILLTIAFTSSVSTLILDSLVHGLIAGIVSTIVLCLFGEIIPQAICSKYSLPIGSSMTGFTYFFIYLTSIFSYPLSKVVDYFLGEEMPVKYKREAIKELIKKGQGLQEKQFRIIAGALELRSKHVSEIMVPLDDVFMLSEDEKLNFETIVNIYNTGYSRLPVYEDQSREDIVGWIHIKDLTLVDPDDDIPVKTLMNVFKHPLVFCFDTDTLTKMFEIFRQGSTHMAFVLHRTWSQTQGEYSDECVGIVTLHDVIETMIQFEISEELAYYATRPAYGISYLRKIIENQKRKTTFVAARNAAFESDQKSELKKLRSSKSLSKLPAPRELAPTISPQTKLVVFQLLGTIKPFTDDFIEKGVLEKLVNDDANIIYKYKSCSAETVAESERPQGCFYIYTFEKPCDFFVLIIEGSLLVEIGQERTECYTKEFDYFGVEALLDHCETAEQVMESKATYHPYIPEYSLKIDFKDRFLFSSTTQYPGGTSKGPQKEMIAYLKIDHKCWLNAVKASNLKRQQQSLQTRSEFQI